LDPNEELSLEQEERENESNPLWKEKGFDSLEEYVAHLEGETETARSRATLAEKALQATAVGPGQGPVFDRAAYDEDPDGYSAKFNLALQDFMTKAQKPAYSQAVLNAAIESILLQGEKRNINRHVLYGTMQSIIASDVSKQNMAETPDGVRELGRLALENFETVEKKKLKDDEVPAEHKQPKGSPSATPKKAKGKESELEMLEKEVKEKAEAGLTGDLFDIVMKRNAAKLKLDNKKS